MPEIIGLVVGILIMYILSRYEREKELKSKPGVVKVKIEGSGTLKLNNKIINVKNFEQELKHLKAKEIWCYAPCENDEQKQVVIDITDVILENNIPTKHFFDKNYKKEIKIKEEDGKTTIYGEDGYPYEIDYNEIQNQKSD